MILFPNGKINLGLNIVHRRADGYHDLETVFYPIAIHDALEILASTDGAVPGGVELHTSGLTVDGEADDNICVRVWKLLKTLHPTLPPVRIFLHKSIPMGAGLGGGSADGAFALKMIAETFDLPLHGTALAELALRLGSDCPFFLVNRPAFGSGRGERLEPLPLDLSAYDILLVHPGIHVSTAQAFSGVTAARPRRDVRETVAQPVETWKDDLVNDFERTVFAAHPEIGAIKSELYAAGAVYASMSGTGSSVYGLFPKGSRPQIPFPSAYLSRWMYGGPDVSRIRYI